MLKTKNRSTPKTFNNFFDIYQNLHEWETICKKWPEVYQKHKEFIVRLEDLREERSPFVRISIYAMIFEGLSNNIEYVPDKTLTEPERLEIDSLQSPIPERKKRIKYKERIKQISENILSDEQTEKIVSVSWPKAGTSYIDAIKDSVFLYRLLGKNILESILSAVILQRNSFAHSGLFNSAPAKLSTIEASIAGYFMELLIITSLLTECNLTNDEREHFVRDLRCNIEFGIWLRNN